MQWSCIDFDPFTSNFFVAAHSTNAKYDDPAFIMHDQHGGFVWAKTLKDNGVATYKVDLSCFITPKSNIFVQLTERSPLDIVILKLSINGDLLLLKDWGPSGVVKTLDLYQASMLVGDTAENVYLAMPAL